MCSYVMGQMIIPANKYDKCVLCIVGQMTVPANKLKRTTMYSYTVMCNEADDRSCQLAV